MNLFNRKATTIEQHLRELSITMIAEAKKEVFNIDAELESLQARRQWQLARIARLERDYPENAKVTQIGVMKSS